MKTETERRLPKKTFMPGWPKTLKGTDGFCYARLRDGKPTSDSAGSACLYARVDEKGKLLRNRQYHSQYIPALGDTLPPVPMNAGAWATSRELRAIGEPPLRIPREPVFCD